jgi:hypothetical protein
MNDDQIDTIGSSSIYAKWMNILDLDNHDVLRKMMVNSRYGVGVGMSVDTPRGTNNSIYGINGLRPKEIILDDMEMTNLRQEIAITLKIPENLLFDKQKKPEKLKINFEGDSNE